MTGTMPLLAYMPLDGDYDMLSIEVNTNCSILVYLRDMGDVYCNVQGGSNLRDDKWHHIAYTRNASNESVKLYIDGELVGTTIHPNCSKYIYYDGSEEPASGEHVLLGCMSEHNSSACKAWGRELFNGSIDEVMFINRTLTSDEINQSAALYPFDTALGAAMSLITFNVTSSELDVTDIDGVNITCNYTGFNQSGDTSNMYGPYAFPDGNWECTFTHDAYFPETESFSAAADTRVDVIMNYKHDLTNQQHLWLEDIYNCLYYGNCKLTDTLNNTNVTVTSTWDKFQRTDQSVVILENVTNKVVNGSLNLTIDYQIDVPTKEDYVYLPMRLYYWFLDESNTTCYDQAEDVDSAETPHCNPLIAQTIGKVGTQINITVELRPDLPSGTYFIVRNLEIDPPENGVPQWIKYGQEIIGVIEVSEDTGEASIELRETETAVESAPAEEEETVFDEIKLEGEVEQEALAVEEEAEDSTEESAPEITGMVTSEGSESWLSQHGIIAVANTVSKTILIALAMVCMTIYAVRRREY